MRSSWLALVALCLTSFFLAALIAWTIFDAMPHSEDEQANWFQAQVFTAGQVTAPVPVLAEAFPVPFVVEWNGRRFSKYPPGYSLLLVPSVWLDQPWLVNAVAAALGILATFLLGRELFGAETGLWAAALGVLSPLYLLLSGTLLPHVPTLTALTIFAWALVRARRSVGSHGRRYSVLAGLCLGLAVAIRPWTAAAIALPFLALAGADLIRDARRHLGVYLPVAIAAAAVAAMWPVYNWLAAGSPRANPYTLWWDFDRVGFGPMVGNDGYTMRAALANLSADLSRLAALWLAWPGGVWLAAPSALVLAALVFSGEDRCEWKLLAPPLSLIVAYTAYWAGSGELYGPRYYAEGLPYLWILGARGLSHVRRRWTPAVVNTVLLVGLCVGTLTTTVPQLLQRRNLYGISRTPWHRVVEANVQDALVLVTSAHWTDYTPLSWRNHPLLERSDVVFALALGCDQNALLMQEFPGRDVWYYPAPGDEPLTRSYVFDCGLPQNDK